MFKIEGNTLYLYDDIGPSWLGMIDSGSVIDALNQVGKNNRVNVRISSPGGDVVEGLAIFNALKRHPGGVDTFADGLAASCGSYLFAAGENRVIATNGLLMIHDPWGVSIGNSAEHRKTADVYDKFADNMATDYAESAGMTANAVRAIMQAETWYNAEEAIESGFATAIGDAVIDEPITVASGRYKHTPKGHTTAAKAGSRTQYSVGRMRLRNKIA